ncbi:MAG: bifunctional UDP-N-acetylglucosamine diphosphorylase/glucosamine-1-phosphate N-acetyltransferase GlmU [Solirubrobacterales bacterium]|nr:bifunctional UDP-N-acetylglucosamine diphosphorylase/glucosamine-1-phosphate N-acetyltransferase GlmU [Solirubrobacterales bacterium]
MTAPLVVIIAAGEGTRMRSQMPKLLHPLCGRPLIRWTVAAAQGAGAGNVVVVDGPARRLSEALHAGPEEDAADDGRVASGRIEFAVQERPLGTADAVRAASDHFRCTQTVIVLNGDNPLFTSETIRRLLEAHQRSGAGATIASAVLEDPSGFGRVVRAPDGTVERVVETKRAGDASPLELEIQEVNAGLYAFDGDLLATTLAEVRADNAQGELYLPDVLPLIRRHERTVDAHEIDDPQETLGVNDRRELARVRAVAQRRIHERHMLAGVTIVNPDATVIDADVEIAADATIEPFSSLHGRTRVGGHCTVGPLSTVIDTRLGERSAIIHSYLREVEIGDGVTVGPFAYLRPGTVLREGAKAGTFVEIKNSDIGPGTKIPHLSYIGDTEIGERTNIGAGTITANYDGYRKHRTTIGARVKGGVHTSLVAPVSVGDDAYTAAGSVITKDVPPGALGVARERQQNVEGYAERRAERERSRSRKDGGDSG